MRAAQHQLPAALNKQRQQRARSFPLLTPKTRVSERMGRHYRTPSPLRDSRFELEYDVTPAANEYENRSMAVETPQPSPTLQAADPVTPGFKEPAKGFFGLLTPCTPGFGDVSQRSLTFPKDRADDYGSDRTLSPRDSGSATSPASDGFSTAMPQAMLESSDLAEQQASANVPRSRKGRQYKGAISDDTDDSDDDVPLHTHYDRLQDQIKAAQQVAALAGGKRTTSRRSTRLKQKETTKTPSEEVSITEEKTPAKALEAKALEEVTPARNVTPPESSLTTEAVVHLPPDPSPAHRTLSWDLQYPPSGSTHPSYPYPGLDPRLFFDPSVVPIIDGLPSVFKVPELVLPMGWKHVSWSGFLPIAFDPYHQAFKLTPIGPLPLTCEEVQQGGLAKYVPGGEEHPEAGLLPDMSLMTDGSDEVYNFEGIDWILPWPKHETFDPQVVHGSTSHSSGSASSMQVAVVPISPSFYDEARDCPDNIVDIIDAWRWLEGKELHPDSPFVPTPGRSWKGTGIYRTNIKTKSPIASLMGLVIADTIASPNNFLATLLMNQNGRAFCPFRSVATPIYANITLLRDVEITLVELLSYFPNHYAWRKGADRLIRANFTGSDIANFINWSRALEGDAVKTSGSIKDSLAWEYNPVTRKRVRIERDTETATYTTEEWKYKVWDMIEYPLLGLTHGLKHLPEGPDAGPLTALIKHCREQGGYRILLSDVPDMLKEQGLEPLIEPGENGGDPDKEVFARYQDVLRIDRKRVLKGLKEAGEKKRAAEKDKGQKKKRVKVD